MQAKRLAATAALHLVLSLASAVSVAAEPIAFVGVNVIPMNEERVLVDHTVVIDDGRIISLTPSSQAKVPASATRIAGQGMYLMPGLMDMHVHVGLQRGPKNVEQGVLDRVTQDELFLYIANGVTTIRNMQGSTYHLRLRDRIARGELVAPRMYTAGPLVDGVPPTWPSGHRILVEGADVHAFIRDYMDEGYDLLKTYTNLSEEVYLALLTEAQRMGVPVAGHVPPAASPALSHALGHGKASIEHLLGFDRVMQPDDSAPLAPHGYSGWPTVDPAQMEPWAHKAAAAEVWQCPTLITLHNLGEDLGDEPAQSKALSMSGMQYVSPIRKAMWRSSPLHAKPRADFRRIVRQGQPNRIKMVNALYRAGAPIMVGTDATTAFVIPGYSVAIEMENLVGAGFSPFDALAAATSAPARYLGMDGRLGVVKPGAIADLVLLRGNPLESVGQVRTIAGVMSQGRWFPQETLHQNLQDIRIRNEATQASAPHPMH